MWETEKKIKLLEFIAEALEQTSHLQLIQILQNLYIHIKHFKIVIHVNKKKTSSKLNAIRNNRYIIQT